MYFTGFDCLGCPAAYAPAQDLLLCPTGSGFKDFDRILDLVEIPSRVITGYEAMRAEAERIG